MDQIISSLQQFWEFTGFCNMTWQHIVMIAIGIVFITLAIVKEWEPLLLVPIGFGMIIGNIPMFPGLNIGVYEDGSVLNILYQGVRQGWYPPLIFLGIGAMTDFSALISQPRLILIGAAAQMGIFGAYLLALSMGFMPNEAGAIGIIGGADGSYGDFPFFQTRTGPYGCDCRVGLFLHGTCSGHPEAYHASAHDQEGKAYPYAVSSRCKPEGKDHFPDRGLPHDCIHRPFRSPAFRHAVLR